MVVQTIGIIHYSVQHKLMIVPPLVLFDPSISPSPLLPAGVVVWAIRDPHHIQISRVKGSVFMQFQFANCLGLVGVRTMSTGSKCIFRDWSLLILWPLLLKHTAPDCTFTWCWAGGPTDHLSWCTQRHQLLVRGRRAYRSPLQGHRLTKKFNVLLNW